MNGGLQQLILSSSPEQLASAEEVDESRCKWKPRGMVNAYVSQLGYGCLSRWCIGAEDNASVRVTAARQCVIRGSGNHVSGFMYRDGFMIRRLV